MNGIFKVLTFILITFVIITGILLPIPEIPALGDKARVLYFHVPMSWISVLAFFMSMWYSIRYLKTRESDYDLKSFSSAQLGFLFCILATATGSLWAKFNWGSFWNWDPRQTSIFILLMIYGAYFALRSAIDSEEQRAKLSSVYSIIAGVTVPFFVFIMPRLVESLHPDPIINSQGKIHMDSTMLTVFLTSLVGFTMLYLWILNLKFRLERLQIKKLKTIED
ncbi:MAG: cytochrome c biogenesis protein [Ignavibacteria bacterium]|jgi:heme exporter protein C|nr:cytochrome c biogenesis protein CcsA [Ignavibacteria bacterium]MBK6771957.1 cytochrome c biogenesis protein CcsA [Ignavibacteria bacterium]MBK7157172.1 cytochrome c biogenesis protein CcsA [Ignavibacteria bacterium]MBK7256110.1 cytochrome c biogenesis protein CcsA [Ignavibacteria bacterium]MBK7444667.1 cytochrome c biogenesis protein CcsA [Ignavibacteria bacterium]